MNTARVRGVANFAGETNVDGVNEIVFDPKISQSPPAGFDQPGPLVIVPGSWKRVLNTP